MTDHHQRPSTTQTRLEGPRRRHDTTEVESVPVGVSPDEDEDFDQCDIDREGHTVHRDIVGPEGIEPSTQGL